MKNKIGINKTQEKITSLITVLTVAYVFHSIIFLLVNLIPLTNKISWLENHYILLLPIYLIVIFALAYLFCKKVNFKLLVKNKIISFLLYPATTIIAYYFARFLVRLFFVILFVGDTTKINSIMNNNVVVAVYSAVFFLIMLAILYLVPTKLTGVKITKKEIGLVGLPKWSDIGVAFVGLLAALLVSGILMLIVQAVVPNFNINQAQNVGYSSNHNPLMMIIAFLMLSVFTPLCEEVIFRGVLYSQVRKISIYGSMLITSIVFAYAHGQLNVAVTTFAMSMIMCYIREYVTETLWAPIFLHSLKNGIAFMFLFIFPNLMLLNE